MRVAYQPRMPSVLEQFRNSGVHQLLGQVISVTPSLEPKVPRSLGAGGTSILSAKAVRFFQSDLAKLKA